MKRALLRLSYHWLTLAAGGLFALGGCGLSDQQLATIWSSVLSSGLNTVVSTAITQVLPA